MDYKLNFEVALEEAKDFHAEAFYVGNAGNVWIKQELEDYFFLMDGDNNLCVRTSRGDELQKIIEDNEEGKKERLKFLQQEDWKYHLNDLDSLYRELKYYFNVESDEEVRENLLEALSENYFHSNSELVNITTEIGASPLFDQDNENNPPYLSNFYNTSTNTIVVAGLKKHSNGIRKAYWVGVSLAYEGNEVPDSVLLQINNEEIFLQGIERDVLGEGKDGLAIYFDAERFGTYDEVKGYTFEVPVKWQWVKGNRHSFTGESVFKFEVGIDE